VGVGGGVGVGSGGGSTGGRLERMGATITQRRYHSDGPYVGDTELRFQPDLYGSSYGLSVSRYAWNRTRHDPPLNVAFETFVFTM
jgi:hypothetical protein